MRTFTFSTRSVELPDELYSYVEGQSPERLAGWGATIKDWKYAEVIMRLNVWKRRDETRKLMQTQETLRQNTVKGMNLTNTQIRVGSDRVYLVSGKNQRMVKLPLFVCELIAVNPRAYLGVLLEAKLEPTKKWIRRRMPMVYVEWQRNLRITKAERKHELRLKRIEIAGRS